MEDTKSLLLKELADLKRMGGYLADSMARCADAALSSDMASERAEAFTSRFARTADLLVNKTLRTLDRHELEPSGSLLYVLHHAEKRGLIDSARDLRLVKNLRNAIAHDYAGENLQETLRLCRQWTPVLLDAIDRLERYVGRLPE
jgi:hypothetical protein